MEYSINWETRISWKVNLSLFTICNANRYTLKEYEFGNKYSKFVIIIKIGSYKSNYIIERKYIDILESTVAKDWGKRWRKVALEVATITLDYIGWEKRCV